MISPFLALNKSWEVATNNVQYPSLIDSKYAGAKKETYTVDQMRKMLDPTLPEDETLHILSNEKSLAWLHALPIEEFDNPGEVNGLAGAVYFAHKIVKEISRNGSRLYIWFDMSYHSHIRNLRPSSGFSFAKFLYEKSNELLEFSRQNPELFAATCSIWKILRSGVAHELFKLKDQTPVAKLSFQERNAVQVVSQVIHRATFEQLPFDT